MARGRGKTFSADFKTKVVLELLEAEQTIAQISSKYLVALYREYLTYRRKT
jgi:putative transposase